MNTYYAAPSSGAAVCLYCNPTPPVRSPLAPSPLLLYIHDMGERLYLHNESGDDELYEAQESNFLAPPELPNGDSSDPVPEQRTEQEILALLHGALSEAWSAEAYDKIKERDNRVIAQYVNRDITRSEFNERRELAAIPDSGKIQLRSFEEFAIALDCLHFRTDQDRLDLLGHELSHYTAARDAGLNAWFTIRFLRNESGGTSVIYNVEFDLPAQLSDSERAEIVRSIASAPERLSLSDRQMLGIL